MSNLLLLLPALLAIIYAVVLVNWINKLPTGNERMQAIAKAIQEGAKAYLARQYRTIAYVAIVVFAVLWIFINLKTGLGFLVGAVLSGIAGYLGMTISVRANVRTAEAAKKGLSDAFDVAVKGGSITGLLVVGLGLLGVVGFYIIFKDINALIRIVDSIPSLNQDLIVFLIEKKSGNLHSIGISIPAIPKDVLVGGVVEKGGKNASLENFSKLILEKISDSLAKKEGSTIKVADVTFSNLGSVPFVQRPPDTIEGEAVSNAFRKDLLFIIQLLLPSDIPQYPANPTLID